MNRISKFLSEIVIILVFSVCCGLCATFSPSASAFNTTRNSSVPVYRFHYIVRDEKTGDYKTQEEQRTGDSVTGSYVVAEPNGDLRVVNYAADAANGFKADINIQRGGSPVKQNIGNPLSTASPYRDGIAPFNLYRTGMSPPPPRNRRKPARGFNPIVVGAQPLVTVPVPAVKEAGSVANASTIPIAKKSVHVDLTYNEDSIGKMGKKMASLKNGNIAGTNNVDIPSTVLEIMNRDKAKSMAFDTMMAIDRNDSSKIDTIQNTTESAPVATTVATTTPPIRKIVVPQRPMRLIGLSPIYMEMPQLQSIAENLTAVPQLHLEPFTNIQYATPAPFLSGPLLGGGPVGPFRNLPRSVPETINVPPDYPFVNSIPIFSSIPISAPIIAPPPPLSLTPLQTSDTKVDTKNDNKTPPSSLPLCQDCIFPTGFAATLPLVKMPAAAPVPAAVTVSASAGPQQLQKTQCPPNNGIASGQWNPYTPNFMYVLMPMPFIKNKFNETRPATLPMWTK